MSGWGYNSLNVKRQVLSRLNKPVNSSLAELSYQPLLKSQPARARKGENNGN